MLPVIFGRGERRTELLAWIDEQQRSSLPRRSHHTLLEVDHGAGHWVEVLRARDRIARYEATIDTETNRIEIQTEGVRHLRVHLLPELIDLSGPVTIVVDGMLVHDRPIEPTIEGVLDSWWAFHGDRRRVTAHSIEFFLE